VVFKSFAIPPTVYALSRHFTLMLVTSLAGMAPDPLLTEQVSPAGWAATVTA
jgi:hypothetical protein